MKVSDEYKIDSVDEYYEEVAKEEIEENGYVSADTAEAMADTQEATSSLPAAVDNSTSKYFPAIGNQGSIGSCTTFAQVYYQMSYEVNKNLDRAATAENTLAPLFVYSLINGGVDEGSYTTDCYSVLQYIGAVEYGDYNNDSCYTNWNASEKLWSKTSNYRISSYKYFSHNIGTTGYEVSSNDDSDLDLMKTALSNGEILTLSTTSRGWRYTSILKNSKAPENNKYLDECAIYRVDQASGGHRVAIVGYDDDIWIDINDNSQVDDGEMGAFKMVNSWGESYKNDGFCWVAYDAFNEVSEVEGVNPNYETSRIRYATMIARITVEDCNSDSNIKLVYTLNTEDRKDIMVSLCAQNNVTGEMNGASVYPDFVSLKGNRYLGFKGEAQENDGTFAFDLDRVAPEINSDNISDYTFSVTFWDEYAGYSTTIKDVHIIDENNGKIYSVKNASTAFPKTFNNTGSSYTFETTEDTNYMEVYYDGYTASYMHFINSSGTWTTAPGVEMAESDMQDGYSYRTFIYMDENKGSTSACFNDGYGNWDNNGGSNYSIPTGTCGVKNGSVTKIGGGNSQHNYTTIYYKGYNNPYIHYSVGGTWTAVPGVAMTASTAVSGYPFEYTINLNDATYANVCFNNGNGTWDSKNGENYHFEAGKYTYSNGTITKIS